MSTWMSMLAWRSPLRSQRQLKWLPGVRRRSRCGRRMSRRRQSSVVSLLLS